MSVSYHLVPVDKETESFITFSNNEFNLNNDFSIFAELMINFPKKFISFFAKNELVFDFIYALNQSEISKATYQPENLRFLFVELLEILKTKDGFPIKMFNYFVYENIMESTFLYVNLKGSELNNIVEDKVHHKEANFEINTSFDKWNNFGEYGGKFKQIKPTVYIKTEEGERLHSNLDLNSFPSQLNINRTLNNINLGQEIKQVSLITKTPYEHLLPTFKHLIEVCTFCIDRNFGLKSFISC